MGEGLTPRLLRGALLWLLAALLSGLHLGDLHLWQCPGRPVLP